MSEPTTFDPPSKAECVCPSAITATYCPTCNPETYALLYAAHRKDRVYLPGGDILRNPYNGRPIRPSSFEYETR